MLGLTVGKQRRALLTSCSGAKRNLGHKQTSPHNYRGLSPHLSLYAPLACNRSLRQEQAAYPDYQIVFP